MLATNEDYALLQKSLSSCFATDVELKRNQKGKGKIVRSIERASFADSLELAEAWLNRHNAQK